MFAQSGLGKINLVVTISQSYFELYQSSSTKLCYIIFQHFAAFLDLWPISLIIVYGLLFFLTC